MKIHPAILMVTLVIGLGGAWCGMMFYVASTSKPPVLSEREIRTMRYVESHKSLEVRAMEAEDERMIRDAGDDRDRAQDNRGYYDQ